MELIDKEQTMSKKLSTQIGDIYEVPLTNGTHAYFHYIMKDGTQLDGDVIRVFKKRYRNDDFPKIEQILADDIDFHIHTFVAPGAEQDIWKKVGFANVPRIFDRPWFFVTLDGPEDGIEISTNWEVWQAGDDDFTYVGQLPSKYHHLEEGSVYPPFAIVNRIENGSTGFKIMKFK